MGDSTTFQQYNDQLEGILNFMSRKLWDSKELFWITYYTAVHEYKVDQDVYSELQDLLTEMKQILLKCKSLPPQSYDGKQDDSDNLDEGWD